MKNRKKINKNAFNEKLVHRYLLEKYYFASKKEINELLPEAYKGLDINLVVPEDSKRDDGYRADLTIYFKGLGVEVPVEVKWSAKDLKKDNQLNYIIEYSGFVVSFDNSGLPEGVLGVEINYEDFKDWVSGNISKLVRESITDKIDIRQHVIPKQNWLVFLRGSESERHFNMMLKDSSHKPFWAFRQNRKAIKNILDIQKGDNILFLLGKGQSQNQGYSNNPSVKLHIRSYYLATVKEPHYMSLGDGRGVFFEEEDKPINERKWPHFIDFKIDKDKEINGYYGKQEELGIKLAQSTNNGGGTPVNLTLSEYEDLLDNLNKI